MKDRDHYTSGVYPETSEKGELVELYDNGHVAAFDRNLTDLIGADCLPIVVEHEEFYVLDGIAGWHDPVRNLSLVIHEHLAEELYLRGSQAGAKQACRWKALLI